MSPGMRKDLFILIFSGKFRAYTIALLTKNVVLSFLFLLPLEDGLFEHIGEPFDAHLDLIGV